MAVFGPRSHQTRKFKAHQEPHRKRDWYTYNRQYFILLDRFFVRHGIGCGVFKGVHQRDKNFPLIFFIFCYFTFFTLLRFDKHKKKNRNLTRAAEVRLVPVNKLTITVL